MAKQRTNEFELTMALQQLFKTFLRGVKKIDATIDAVNNDFTVDVNLNGTIFSDVPIQVLKGSQGDFYAKPKVGSHCLVSFRDGNINLPQLEQCQQYDEFIFLQGNNGGMVLVNNLVTRLNKIENQQNQILDALKNINIASTPFPFAPIFGSINDLIPTNKSDIENTKILQ